ncbi:MAG: c-type cytochrome, partial [Verrucomicrobia bacterium]|nr:c-type cytochrome [Verrucomicrobiota bacterium]
MISARDGVVQFSLTYSTDRDPTERPVSLDYYWAPWAPTNQISSAVTQRTGVGVGDWQHGRELFFSDQVQCAKCHRVRGEGATVGPDLSNLVFRDAASVLRDIREPSAAINPDYVTYNVTRTDGESFTGFIRANERDALRVIGADGKEVVVP